MKRPSLCCVLLLGVISVPVAVLGGIWLWGAVVRPLVRPYRAGETPWGYTVEMRANTGDLRFKWLGMTYRQQNLPADTRDQLYALASRWPWVPDRWVRVADGAANSFQEQYSMIPAWEEVSPAIAGAAQWALASWLEASHGEVGGEGEILSKFLLERTETGEWVVRPDWQEDVRVQDFLHQMERMGVAGAEARTQAAASAGD
jgi:hypothetical protein